MVFLESNGYDGAAAVSALQKLATLGADHTFLSSHPAPGDRADRLEGKPETSDPEKSVWDRLFDVLSLVKQLLVLIMEKLLALL